MTLSGTIEAEDHLLISIMMAIFTMEVVVYA